MNDAKVLARLDALRCLARVAFEGVAYETVLMEVRLVVDRRFTITVGRGGVDYIVVRGPDLSAGIEAVFEEAERTLVKAARDSSRKDSLFAALSALENARALP